MKKNEIKIEFIKDFAGKKKGDVIAMDSMIASGLIRKDKVAVAVEAEKFQKDEDEALAALKVADKNEKKAKLEAEKETVDAAKKQEEGKSAKAKSVLDALKDAEKEEAAAKKATAKK